MTINEIIELTGLSCRAFAIKYKIPYRTVWNWSIGEDSPHHRDCPEYVLELLEFKVRHDFKVKKSK